MPELPEVTALVEFLRPRLVGSAIAQIDIAELSLLRTADPPLDAVIGLEISEVMRIGKALILEFDGLFLVCRFARAGWLTWHDTVPTTPVRMGKGPLGMRVGLVSGAGFDLTEAGTKKNASVSLVRALSEIEVIANVGPDALAVSEEAFAEVLAGSRSRIKTVLEDQVLIAGIGNAFSDEILHTAQVSPFAIADRVDAETVYAAMTSVLTAARETVVGLPPAKIKAAKKKLLRVHGRAGDACPVCGTTIAEVSFADKSLQYCPGCQTGGKRLNDRRMDRLLR